MIRVPRLARAAWTIAGFAFAIAIGSAAAILLVNVDARAQVDAQEHLLSFYDATAPGVNSNIQERFCVVNKSPYGDFDPDYWQSEISTWLNDPLGWEAIATSKVDFTASCDSGATPEEKCQTVHVCIEFWDFSGGSGPCPGASGCVGPSSLLSGSIDGHPHRTSKFIALPVDPWWNGWRCQGATCELDEWDDKQRVINHEMGHVMGEFWNHGGPEFGVVSGGDFWDGNWDFNPTPGEIDRFRAHYDGEPARPAAPCVGFPEDDRVLVSWFDAAEDETDNDVDLYRIPLSEEGALAFSMESGVAPGFGSLLTFVSDPRSDVTSPGNTLAWIAWPAVSGGPRGILNSDPVGALAFTGLDWPSRPCSLKFEATGPFGQVQLTWVDGSYDETEFAVYYQYVSDYPGGSDGSQGLDEDGWWPQPGQPAILLPAGTTAYADFAPGHAFLEFDLGRVCAKVVALESGVASFDSNYSCTRITSDWDGDGFADDIEDFVGTDPDDGCADTSVKNDEADDKWPPDTNDDQYVNTFDVAPFIPVLNSVAPGPPYTVRLDLNTDGKINTHDVARVGAVLNTGCDP